MLKFTIHAIYMYIGNIQIGRKALMLLREQALNLTGVDRRLPLLAIDRLTLEAPQRPNAMELTFGLVANVRRRLSALILRKPSFRRARSLSLEVFR